MDSRRESDSRPAGNGPATKSLGSTADSTVNLWRLAASCPGEQVFALSLGYRLGLLERDGYLDGYSDAERHMADRWHRVYLDVHAMAKRPTFAELEQRRGEA